MAKYTSKQRAYGDAEGMFGFPMPSALAAEAEKVFKGLPKHLRDMGFQRRSFVPKGIEFKDGERSDVSLITSDALDRDSEVMLQKGANWEQFLKNPVVTFAHKYDELPVGRALWVQRVDDDSANGYIAKTKYTSRPESWKGQWMPDAVWHFVQSGDMPGKSIGFLPLDGSPPEEKEIEARPELAGARFVIRKWLALEYAVAPVQSNPDALVLAAAKARDCGLSVDMILDAHGLQLPGGPTTFEAYYKEVAEGAEPKPEARRAKAAPRLVITSETIREEIAKATASEFDRLRGRV